MRYSPLKETVTSTWSIDGRTMRCRTRSLKMTSVSSKQPWYNNKFIECFISSAEEQIGHIKRGIRLLEKQTCLRFRPRQNDTEDYIRVIVNNPSGCWSWVGNIREGMQELHLAPNSLENGCFRLGTIVHEFIHAIGFFHMQSASDRDDFVEINYDNILEGTESNFLKYSADEVSSFDVTYDYGSVMHYGATAFSKNGLPTIVPKVGGNGQIKGVELLNYVCIYVPGS